jgi:hypothetical protein
VGKVHAKLQANPEKLWSLSEMERTAVNRMLWVRIKARANTSFLIVQRKLQRPHQRLLRP